MNSADPSALSLEQYDSLTNAEGKYWDEQAGRYSPGYTNIPIQYWVCTQVKDMHRKG
jgi:hypothetical protein